MNAENQYEGDEMEDEDDDLPAAKGVSMPVKSKEKYELYYKRFMDWKAKHPEKNFTESLLLEYMKEMSATLKPSSLWTHYSVLKTTLMLNHDVDLGKFNHLRSFMKQISSGYTPKKSKVLSPAQIQQFLDQAPDQEFLFTKVTLILGVNGGCRRFELKNLTIEDITDVNNEYIVKIFESNNRLDRVFVITGTHYETVKKYIQLRPPGIRSFFLNYQHGKCTKQCVGINKLAKQAEVIARFLNLKNPETYTGHCFRRSGFGNGLKSNSIAVDLKNWNIKKDILEKAEKEKMVESANAFEEFGAYVAAELRLLRPRFAFMLQQEIQRSITQAKLASLDPDNDSYTYPMYQVKSESENSDDEPTE